MSLVRPLLLPFVLLAAILLPTASASALSYPVTSTADTEDKGTLRASIKEALAHGGADSIPIETTGTITLGKPLQPIIDVTITGPGAASLTVRRDPLAAAFGIFETSGTVVVSGITISGGLSSVGGGILNGSTGDLTLVGVAVTGNEARNFGGSLASAGGIFNNGILTLRESVVSGNRALASGSAENIAAGAGIESEGTLFVELSTISGNVAEALGGGESKAEAIGGGIAIANISAPTIIEESTISGNSVFAADATGEAAARGGGIGGNGTVSLTGSTVAKNSAELEAAGASSPYVAGANVDVGVVARTSIIALPAGEGESCANPLVSGGFNLDEDGSCGLGKSSDLAGPAGLDPVLRDNGGPTPTHALLPGSIAIDRGNSFGSGVDQRGLPRPSDFPEVSNTEGGDGSDIGAFELQVPAPPGGGGGPVLVSRKPTDRTPPQTRILSGPPRVTFKTKAKFRFASTEGQSHFQCKLDKKKWRACTNPFKRLVKPARHLFKVRAIDRFGNVDPTPAQFGWRVKPLS